ncbi:porin family protein [Porphyromonas uenonis]|uniref:porin family protein n=1 Tax=Porphyromonas uenonis TaxID=281920 RepID=UPI0026ED5304|nr:porin family protein [Porphyromonas uenonis]
MKKVILAIVTMLAATTLATAQMRPTIKVEAGANFANQTMKAGNLSLDGKMMIGYRAGVGVEFGITDGFYVNPGLYFLSRGSKSTVETPEIAGISTKTTNTTWLHNVEVPVHVGYRAALAPGMAVSIQAGPWFSYGFLGKAIQIRKTTVTGEGKIADAARKAAEAADDAANDAANKGENSPYKNKVLKPFDLGVGMQAGFEYQQLGVNLGFEYGLLNTSAFKNTKVNNMNFYVGLGYRF